MRPTSRDERRKAYLKAAEALFAEMEEWYDDHPEASFGEIEEKLRQERRRLMGETTEILINGRQSGQQVEAPACPSCGQSMRFEGYRGRRVDGLEGESELERAYYRCPHGCGESLFPPRPSAGSASGPLE